MSSAPEYIRIRLRWMAAGTPSHKKEAEQDLLALGKEAVPWVIEAIQAELDSLSPRNLPTFFSALLHPLGQDISWSLFYLARLLAQFGDPRGLDILVTITLNNEQGAPLHQPLQQLLDKLQQRDDPETIQALIQALERFLVTIIFLNDTVRIATLLVESAERIPRPELHAVVPLLHRNLLLRARLAELHQRLEAALGDSALPIPASAENKTEGLPLPAHSRPVNKASPKETKSGYPLGAD